MRSFRTAAVAAASTIALAMGTTTIASAEGLKGIEVTEGSTIPENSSRFSDNLNGDKEADGRALFGSSKVNEETGGTYDSQPAWAKLLHAATVIGGIGSFIGLVVGPIYNYIVYGQGR